MARQSVDTLRKKDMCFDTYERQRSRVDDDMAFEPLVDSGIADFPQDTSEYVRDLDVSHFSRMSDYYSTGEDRG